MIIELYGYRLEQDYYQPFHEPKEEVTIPHAELELIKTIGQRMREARGLCKYSQANAARLIGFSQKDLKYIENGITQFISLMTLKRAAQVYDVSTDYLLGLNDDWESAPDVRAERDISVFLLTNQIELFSRVAARQLRIERKIRAIVESVDALRQSLAAVYEGFDKFKARNEGFEDMPAGAMLQSRIENANEKAIQAHLALIKAKLLPMAKGPVEVVFDG